MLKVFENSRRVAFFAGALLLAACSHDAGSSPSTEGGSGTSASSDGPSIHYDQVSVMTVDGVPQEEHAYQDQQDACQKSGLPMHALSPAEVGKLGRIHVEAWIGPDRQARHTEEWHENVGKPCQFVLDHKDSTQIDEASGRSTLVDNTTQQAEVQELGPQEPAAAVAANDGAMDDAAKQAGWSKLADASANGASCAVWRDPVGTEVCMWSGGGKWGYTSYGVNSPRDGVSGGETIVLWVHPGKGAAWRLQTQTFNVGQPLDDRVFQMPGGVAVHKASP